MEPEVKQLKIEGVAPRTPPTSDSEDDLNIDQIRDHRKEKSKQAKKDRKADYKKAVKDFRISLGMGFTVFKYKIFNKICMGLKLIYSFIYTVSLVFENVSYRNRLKIIKISMNFYCVYYFEVFKHNFIPCKLSFHVKRFFFNLYQQRFFRSNFDTYSTVYVILLLGKAERVSRLIS